MILLDIKVGTKFIFVNDIDLKKHYLEKVPVYVLGSKDASTITIVQIGTSVFGLNRIIEFSHDDGLAKEKVVPIDA